VPFNDSPKRGLELELLKQIRCWLIVSTNKARHPKKYEWRKKG